MTDISAVTGNRHLTSAEDCAGTITVLRWPNPSYDNQVRYRSGTVPDSAAQPNDGAFLGVVVGSSTLWLAHDFSVAQRYDDPVSDTVKTVYRRPGLTVTVTDVVDAHRPVLTRRISVDPASAVVSVLAFAHFDPTLAHQPDYPIDDSVLQDDIVASGAYDPRHDLAVTTSSQVAVAMGFGARSTAHQVGQDGYWSGASAHAGPTDAFDEASRASLTGSSFSPGPQVDVALETRLDTSGHARLMISAGADPAAAAAEITAERKIPFGSVVATKHAVLSSWLSSCPVPASPDPLVVEISRRAEIALWQAIDTRGPIVASIATQSPYAEDWLRDGSFLNHLLDLCGHHQEVARHDLFYASVQVRNGRASPKGTSASVPAGNWAMNYYADGTVGGPIPWEIDETGFGTWTLVDHFEMTHDRRYLAEVYPAVEAAANFLSGPGLDKGTGLTIAAREDDHTEPTYPPTMHASAPVLLALRSSVIAANALGHKSDADRWQRRADQEARAIDSHYHAGPSGTAWSSSFENGGWALWPAVVAPPGNARMKAQAAAVWGALQAHFAAPAGRVTSGSYEAAGLLGLAEEGQATHDRTMLDEANTGIEWIAHEEALPGTGLLGESWEVKNGVVATGVSQPHVWEMTLFALTALEIWGPRR